MDHRRSVALEVRRAAAFPIYAIALVVSLLGDLLGILAAKIAGDDWPE